MPDERDEDGLVNVPFLQRSQSPLLARPGLSLSAVLMLGAAS